MYLKDQLFFIRALSLLKNNIWMINLMLIISLAWAGAKVTTNVIYAHFPQPEIFDLIDSSFDMTNLDLTIYPTSIQRIKDRNVTKTIWAPPIKPGGDGNEELLPLNIKLEGIATGPGWAYTTIFDKDNNKILVAEIGDEVRSGSRVESITTNRVRIKRANGLFEEHEINFTNIQKH